MQQAGVRVAAIRVDAAIISHHLRPSRLARLEDGRIGQRRAVELVLVQIRDDLVTVLNEGDGPPRAASGPTWPMTRPTDPPRHRASVISATTILS